jgi:hypothetical protein
MKHEETTAAETNATVAPQGAHVAPATSLSKKRATHKKGAPTGQKTAKGGKTPPKQTAKGGKKGAKLAATATSPRAESKGAKILDLIRRAKGATLAEIMKATDWQAHSVRGFISTATKKYGVQIESSRNENGDRVYRVTK